MANEDKKDFNAMLHQVRDMPRTDIVTDAKTIEKYGGSRMFFAPPMAYNDLMKTVPEGYVTTLGALREVLARQNGADFTEPITAGAFSSIAAWASEQREEDKIPYWRTLKAGGEVNPKYPGGALRQVELLKAEGHAILRRGRKNIRYYVADYEKKLFVPVV